MTNSEAIFVIDAGNTVLKIGVFKNDELTEVHRINGTKTQEISKLWNLFKQPKIILSSVLDQTATFNLSQLFNDVFIVSAAIPLPIELNYKTKGTLGIDRICNAVAAAHIVKGKNTLIIDAGTCLKFDFIDASGVYQGGAISPGIQMRYKSLNDYTANLPLLNDTSKINLLGKSTAESIHSGVVNGIQAEINDISNRYASEFSDLTFFMTGGDAQNFEIPNKNNIFVDENLTLKGLYQIYLFNAQ